MNIHKLTRCALFAAVALIVFVLESLIPPLVPVPGFKIGLANVVTLSALYILGRREAFFILIVRIVLGNIFTGQLVSMMYSLCGGFLCFLVTAALKNCFKNDTLWALGIIGALCHNLGQTLCAYFMYDSVSIIYYGAVLCLASFVTGAFTGLCAQFTVKHFLKERNL